MKAASDFKIIPSFSITSSTVPLTYASTSTGIGASLTITRPVLSDIDSIVPSTGDSTEDLNIPKIPAVSAIISPFLTLSPSLITKQSITSLGSIFKILFTFNICTLPGRFVEATTVSGFKLSPFLTKTFPLRGKIRSFLKSVF